MRVGVLGVVVIVVVCVSSIVVVAAALHERYRLGVRVAERCRGHGRRLAAARHDGQLFRADLQAALQRDGRQVTTELQRTERGTAAL